MVHLEGDLLPHGRRGRRAGRGAEYDRVIDDLVVDRDHRRAPVGRRHRDAPHTVRGEQSAAFLRAEVPQLRVQKRVALAGGQIYATSAQGSDGSAQRVGQPDESPHARVGGLFLQVRQVVGRHAGAAGCFPQAEPTPVAFEGHAPADVAGVGGPGRRGCRGDGPRLTRVRLERPARRPGLSVLDMVDVRVGPGEHERHLVRVRPAHVVGGCSVLVVESDDFSVTPGGTGRRAFDDELVAEVSSHDRRPLRRMVLYPTCHARHAAAWDDRPLSAVRAGPAQWHAVAPRTEEATCTTDRSRNS